MIPLRVTAGNAYNPACSKRHGPAPSRLLRIGDSRDRASRVRGPDLDDIQAGERTRRAFPKGEEGSLVVYADRIIRSETDAETGEEAERAIPFMKGYTVFNVEQIEDLPAHYYAKPQERTDPLQRIAHADVFFAATGANLVHGGSKACYVYSTDNIHMPCIDFFESAGSYYATLAHECTHWTRHEKRLNRDFGRKRFGDEG